MDKGEKMRLIDADALPIKFWGDRFVVVAKVDIENAPTVDAVEVVRCKDCRCAKKMECVFISNNEQGITLHCLMHEMFVDDDDFCSWGERKEDGKNG